MRGLRGLRQCEMFDRVWGLKLPEIKPYTWGDGGYPGEDAYSAVIVPAKRAPFARAVGSVSAEGTPADYQSGFEVTLSAWGHVFRPARTTFMDALPDTDYSPDASCWGSRVTYVDDEQAYVHYIFTGEDDHPSTVSCWNRIDIDNRVNDVKWFRKRDLRLPEEDHYGDYSPPHNGHQGTAFGPDNQCTPNQWGVGLKYYGFSDYEGNAATYGPWQVVRWVREEGTEYVLRDHFATSASGHGIEDDLQRHSVIMPAPRLYHYTAINGPQEPYWIAHAPNRNGGELVTGTWLNHEGGFDEPKAFLIGDEIKHVLKQNWNGDVVCYNRVQAQDLAIIANDRTQAGGWEYYDGTGWFPTVASEMPTWITRDWSGNIYYGNSDFVRKLSRDGSASWKIDAVAPVNESRPSYHKMFQILPTHRGIDLRHWHGNLADATASPVGMFDGVNHVWAITGSAGSPRSQYRQIFNWTFSFDGSIRLPHVQANPSYRYTRYPQFDESPEIVYSDISLRTDRRILFGRSYCHRDPNELGYIPSVPYLTPGGDPEADTVQAKVAYGSYNDGVHHAAKGFAQLTSLPAGTESENPDFPEGDDVIVGTFVKTGYDPVDTRGECEKGALIEAY